MQAHIGIKNTVYDPRKVRNDVAEAIIFHGTSRGARIAQSTWPRTMVSQRGKIPVRSAPTGSELLPALVTSTASIMPKDANTIPARAPGVQY